MASREVNTVTGEIAEGEIVQPLIRDLAIIPEQIRRSVDVRSWAEALINGGKYSEPDPEYLSRMMLGQILAAETEADVLADAQVSKLQEAITNAPGAGTGPIMITDLYVARSDQEDGFSCYIIFTAVDMETMAERKYSTGAGGLQVQALRLISLGVWPIKCQIKRTDRKDRGGRYLFKMFPVD